MVTDAGSLGVRGKAARARDSWTYPLPFAPYPFRIYAPPSPGASRRSRGRRPLYAQADERVIYTSVVDKDGAPVLDLTIKDFIVREDGQAREMLRVARDNDPLQIALLVDNSMSMRPQAVAACARR